VATERPREDRSPLFLLRDARSTRASASPVCARPRLPVSRGFGCFPLVFGCPR